MSLPPKIKSLDNREWNIIREITMPLPPQPIFLDKALQAIAIIRFQGFGEILQRFVPNLFDFQAISFRLLRDCIHRLLKDSDTIMCRKRIGSSVWVYVCLAVSPLAAHTR